MNLKNTLITILIMAAQILGLSVYTSMVLTPIISESIQKETTRIENNLDNKVKNHYKKIKTLNADTNTLFKEPETSKSTLNLTPKDSLNGRWLFVLNTQVVIDIKHLTRRQQRRKGLR